MPFFSSVDEDQTVERHAREIGKLQNQQAADMLSFYVDARRELQDRLAHARYESFTAQQLRGVLAQVSAAITVINDKLKGQMSEGTYASAFKGVQHLVAEIHKFSHKFTGAVTPIHVNAVNVAIDTKNFLINQYEASMARYDADMRARIGRGLVQAAIQEQPYDQVVGSIGRFFQGQEWEVRRVVRTELHHVYGMGKLTSMRAVQANYLPDLKKALYHPMDARTGQDSIELAEMNPIVPMDQPFKQTYTPIYKSGKRGKPQHYVFMSPPDRPNDRAILIPYRDAWDT
jgi:hypothetical protein